MKNLLYIFVRYSHWFVFILLEIICFTLHFHFNQQDRDMLFTSINNVTGTIYKASAGISEYFQLRTANNELLDRNVQLEIEMEALKDKYKSLCDSVSFSNSKTDSIFASYNIIKAKVISNSIAHRDNYLTLNKGKNDGIETEMGVVSRNGIVGIVYKVSAHYALVLPILNSKSNISCKLKKSNYFGILTWDGLSSRHANLNDMPLHANVTVGDTILTSGYSALFPPGLPVGVVEQVSDQVDALSYLLKVNLFVDYGNLTDVRVIARKGSKEQLELEKDL